jgi:ribosomal protein S18 acetylase RimI-like enzyme
MLEAYAAHPEAFTSSVGERAALPLSWWQARLSPDASSHELVLGVLDGKVLKGAAGLSFDAREKARHKATLFGMYVATPQQRQGLGRALVLAALAMARQRPGVQLVQLTVTDGNHAAQALYERCGFLPFGLEPYAVAVGQHYVSKLHMWCNVALGNHTPLDLAASVGSATAHSGAGHFAGLVQPAPGDEVEAALIAGASACLDRFTACFNAADTAGMDRELQFPHTLLSGAEYVLWTEPGQHPENFFAQLRATGWQLTQYEAREPALVRRDKVHFVLTYSRRDESGRVLSLHKNLWIVTQLDGRWGIALRSY